jgi:hypothetical protein
VFALLAAATPAAAQSTYVGASLVWDIARFSGVDYDDESLARLIGGETAGDGEALGFNLKLGRELGERWGVELEFARTGEFEHRAGFVLPAALERLELRAPSIPFDYETERQHTMIGVLAFAKQELGDRVELSFLGGVSFNRVETEQEFTGPQILIYPPITIPDYETVDYGVGPEVGVEAAVKVGAAAITGGVRLQTAGAARSGWLVRPNVGMRWSF